MTITIVLTFELNFYVLPTEAYLLCQQILLPARRYFHTVELIKTVIDSNHLINVTFTYLTQDELSVTIISKKDNFSSLLLLVEI
jgi:hypothetical protein